MNHIHRFLASATIFAFAILSMPASGALVTYSYVGNPLIDDIDNYSTYPSVRFEFTIEDFLVPKNGRFELLASDPSKTELPFTYFYVSSGLLRYGTSEIYPFSPNDYNYRQNSISMAFNTDAEGNISKYWQMEVYQSGWYGDFEGNIFSINVGSYFTESDDIARDHASYGVDGGAVYGSSSIPGQWTRTTVVPIPGAILLFGSVLFSVCMNNMRQSRLAKGAGLFKSRLG
jgi:hypothetical protein